VIRTQIQLTEAQSSRLHEEARRSGLSTAELIRRCIDESLEQQGARMTHASRLSALEVVGRFSSGRTDISERHDDYLAEAYLQPGKS
jgi:hypothetical protein